MSLRGRAQRLALLAAAGRGAGGTLLLEEGGRLERLGAGAPEVVVTVHDPRAYAAVARHGSVGLGEAYVAGWWDAHDLTAVLRLLWRRVAPVVGYLDGLASRLNAFDGVRRWQAPGREEDRRNIRAHYDLSNDFFGLMLDPTMSYSCAVFDGPDMPLQAAQESKLDRIFTKLALAPDDHLVEIGSGWGGLALRAAGRHGCRVTTTTISAAQQDLAEKRVADAGLAGAVQVVGRDWRDLHGTYDKLVSVEMIEAVDWRHHAAFLRRCADLLAPGGIGVVQAIVIDDRSFDRAKHHQDFIRKMIFPGGCIPSVASLTATMASATDLCLVDLEDIGAHYGETLRRWRSNLATKAADVAALGLGSELHRLWHLYLCYCEAAFEEGHISDVQLVFVKPPRRGALRPRIG